tara:strand:+ start:9320 stop:9757 length:438 start_codon:yes stop_codon:yes gene_type:complete
MIKNSINAQDTLKFASKIAKITPVGKVIALIGDLGTGKTTFAKGFAAVLGISENVGSPTFKLVSEYQGNPHNLYHIDCYRLRDEIDFLNIGGERFLLPENAVTLIEWANIIEKVLLEDIIKIYFKRSEISSNHREITVQGIDFDA